MHRPRNYFFSRGQVCEPALVFLEGDKLCEGDKFSRGSLTPALSQWERESEDFGEINCW